MLSLLVLLPIALVILSISLYNSLIFRKNAIDQSWSAIQTYMKKRYDLIPNLVSVVSEYAKHEKALLTEITELRAAGARPDLKEGQQVENSDRLTETMKKLMVNVENYPDLKANENFLDLQRSLVEVEEQLSAARRSYNAAVTFYNNGVEMIPHNLVAVIMGLKKRDVFAASVHEQETPNVDDFLARRRTGS
jgi:LemA protein